MCMRVDTQIVGALPVVGAVLEQWGLADIVDRVVPWEGDIPLGTLVEVLVMNRLLDPKAMYAVGDWAAASAVTDYFGLSAVQLNDDRLGRAFKHWPNMPWRPKAPPPWQPSNNGT